MGASMAVDSVGGWASRSVGNELNRVNVDFATTQPVFMDMLGTSCGDSVGYASYDYNTTLTFGVDFIPDWGTMDRQNPTSHDIANLGFFF